MIGNAVKVMRIATGEEEEEYEDDGKDPAAKALGARAARRGLGSSPLSSDPRSRTSQRKRGGANPNSYLLIHESPLTDALFLLVSKSDEVTTT